MAYPTTSDEYISKLKFAASLPTMYWNQYPYNLGYMNPGGIVSWDCVNLVKSLLNGWEYNTAVGSFCHDFSRTGDCTEWGLLQQCSKISTDFSRLDYLAVLYMSGHIGTYLGSDEETTINGKTYNVIECTGAWGGGVKYSYVDSCGRRYNHKGGTQCGAWTHHGKMTKWLTYTTKLNGWKKESGVWHYYKNNELWHGWLKDGAYWYYLDSKGAMKTGWAKVKGKWYYLNPRKRNGMPKGAMQTGWIKVKGKWYYLNEDGAMKTGWFKDSDGKKYYLDTSTGAMVKGKQYIDGKTYKFDKHGALIDG